MRPPRPRTARQPERMVQQSVMNLLRSMGAKVYTLGTTRRKGDYAGTMQSPGLPDLIVFLKRPATAEFGDVPMPPTRRLLFIECKAEGGRLRSEQIEFRGVSIAADVAHVVGGLDDVIAWLIENKHLRADQVAHHHTAPEASR